MKKAYTKPEIMFEDFTLSVNIAGDCERPTNTYAQMQCGIEASGVNIFIVNVTGCSDFQADENYLYDGYCYHLPTEDSNLFNS